MINIRLIPFLRLMLGITILSVFLLIPSAALLSAEGESSDTGKSKDTKEESAKSENSDQENKSEEEKSGEIVNKPGKDKSGLKIDPNDVFLRNDQKSIPGQDTEPPGNLDELFEEAKKEQGSLGKVIREREKDKEKKATDNRFVGPFIPSPTKQPDDINIEPFIGPIPPLDEEFWYFSDVEEEEEEYIPQPIEFEDNQPPENRKFFDVDAEKITRDKLNNTILMEGNVKVRYKDILILSEFAEFNDEDEWGKFWGDSGVLCESDDGLAKCNNMEVYFAEEEKNANMHEEVEIFLYGRVYDDKLADDAPRKERLKRALGQDDTTIYCDEASYDWGKKIFHGWIENSEDVKIVQEGRYAYADAVYHDKETELTIMEGDVELWQKDGTWLFDRDVVTDKENKWSNALLRPETTITCDLLESDGDKETVVLEGNVIATQKEKNASADKVTHSEKEKLMIAEGNVKAHQDKGDWLLENKLIDTEKEEEDTIEDAKKPADIETDKFTLWTESEDFIAEGNVKAIQEHQDAAADKVEYTKEIDCLKFFGNVVINQKDKEKKDNKLISDKGILWFTTKVYEAFGNVTSSSQLDVDVEKDKLEEEKNEEEETEKAPVE